MNRFLTRHKKGFSLVEILVVVAIIAVLLGLSATTMKSLSTSKGLQSGMPVMKGVFEEARQLAIGTGNNVRVVIHIDGVRAAKDRLNLSRFGRFVGVAQYFPNSSSDEALRGDYTSMSGVWKMKGRGTLLPEKCFFDEERSLKDKNGNDYASYGTKSSQSDNGGDFKKGYCLVELPGKTDLVKCFFYEFNGIGFPINPQTQMTTNANYARAPRVILSNSRLSKEGGDGGTLEMKLISPSALGVERAYDGFVLTRHGEMLDYKNLDNIFDETGSNGSQ